NDCRLVAATGAPPPAGSTRTTASAHPRGYGTISYRVMAATGVHLQGITPTAAGAHPRDHTRLQHKREFALAARPTWRTNLLYPTFQLPGPRERDFEDVRFGSRPGYFRQGFLAFQHAIFESLLATQNPDAKEYNIELQRSTFPPYVDDVFLVALREWLPLVLMLSFIYPCVNIVKSIVHEKERRLKESMKMMGLPNWVHWMAWFTKCYFFLAISCVVMTALLTIPVKEVGSQVLAVIEFGNVFLVFLFFFVYTFSTICFCFMISGFASQANTASTWAGLLFFITYVPFFIVNPRYETLGLSGKVLVSLFSNCAMAFTGRLIGSFEGAGRGIQMDNIFDPVTPDDQLTYALLMLMLVLDGILYLLIAWYVDAVHPGEYGVPQPWYFFLQRSYWCGEIHAPDTDIDYGSIGNGGVKADFEEEPRNLHPGVQIRNLTKVYKRGVAPAVNQLSLNLYEGQITVLLGHNGAGKTTTMSMLTVVVLSMVVFDEGVVDDDKGAAVDEGTELVDSVKGAVDGANELVEGVTEPVDGVVEDVLSSEENKELVKDVAAVVVENTLVVMVDGVEFPATIFEFPTEISSGRLKSDELDTRDRSKPVKFWKYGSEMQTKVEGRI
ncbi:unnamed protein product, partial [Cyprideis torosa]